MTDEPRLLWTPWSPSPTCPAKFLKNWVLYFFPLPRALALLQALIFPALPCCGGNRVPSPSSTRAFYFYFAFPGIRARVLISPQSHATKRNNTILVRSNTASDTQRKEIVVSNMLSRKWITVGHSDTMIL